MAGWGGLMGVAMLLACATGQGGPPYAATSEPPPKGTPPPRLGELPPPAPGRATETLDENERRFPILEHQLRKERQQRAKPPAAGHVEVVRTVTRDEVHACESLTPEQRIECPLHDPRAVVSIADIPKGVRVTLRKGAAAPEKLQQMLTCHKSLAVARPQTPRACPFLDGRSDAEVVTHDDGRIDVDLERPQDVDHLRQQVRSALASPKR